MPIDSTHSTYDAYAQKWKRAKDACAGQAEVHAAGVYYLPKLKDQTEDDYNSYKLRATYFNATGRTLDALVGMVFRKDPQVESSGIDEIIADVDLQGNGLASFAQMIIREVLRASRFGVLVEYPQVIDAPKTQAEALAQNMRPYLSKYLTESIINWEVVRINNVMQPVFIMLKECGHTKVDEYESKSFDQYRELRLENGVYTQKLWKHEGNKWIQIGEDIIPLLNNKPLNFIPFFPFGADNNSLEITDAPILPLADLNLAHYRVTADYEHGCHYTGLPMLFLSGIEAKENEKVWLGSQAAVITEKEGANGKFIEFTGQGLSALENNLTRKENQMAVLASRVLEQQKSGVESEGAMKLRANGENSVLGGIVNLSSAQLSKMFTFLAKWAGASKEVVIQLNTDNIPMALSAQELLAFVSSWQAGAISSETLFMNLKKGEIYDGSALFLDEQEKIGNREPILAQ